MVEEEPSNYEPVSYDITVKADSALPITEDTYPTPTVLRNDSGLYVIIISDTESYPSIEFIGWGLEN